jgi:hypothetical protein
MHVTHVRSTRPGLRGGLLWRDASSLPPPSLRNLRLGRSPPGRTSAALARTPRTGCLPCGEDRRRWRGPSLDLSGAAVRRPIAPSLIMSSRSFVRSPVSLVLLCLPHNIFLYDFVPAALLSRVESELAEGAVLRIWSSRGTLGTSQFYSMNGP